MERAGRRPREEAEEEEECIVPLDRPWDYEVVEDGDLYEVVEDEFEVVEDEYEVVEEEEFEVVEEEFEVVEKPLVEEAASRPEGAVEAYVEGVVQRIPDRFDWHLAVAELSRYLSMLELAERLRTWEARRLAPKLRERARRAARLVHALCPHRGTERCPISGAADSCPVHPEMPRRCRALLRRRGRRAR